MTADQSNGRVYRLEQALRAAICLRRAIAPILPAKVFGGLDPAVQLVPTHAVKEFDDTMARLAGEAKDVDNKDNS